MRATAVLGLSLALFASAGSQAHTIHDQSKAFYAQMNLRDMWIDHVFWIRGMAMAAAEKNKAAQGEAGKQLHENSKKIAGDFENFYGQTAGGKLLSLLNAYDEAVQAYAAATIPSPSPAKQKQAADRTMKSVQDLADFLGATNPNWSKDALMHLLTTHNTGQMTEIDQIQKKDFAGEAKTWSEMKDHMYSLSDAMAGGIAKQFPEKFLKQ
jgi:hypothetical protein